MAAFRTLPEAFQQTAAQRPNAVALRTSDGSLSITWAEYEHAVRRIAGGLAGLGLARGETFATMLTNRPEFHLATVAAEHLGATAYAIYNTSSVDQVRYVLEHAATQIVVAERQFAETIRSAGGPVEHLLVLEDGDLHGLEPQPGFDFEAAWRSVQPDDVVGLIYTSGTTGPPKGVEHTHTGALAMVLITDTVLDTRADDVGISYLPSAHSGDRVFNHWTSQVCGHQIVCVADHRAVLQVLPDVQPTIFGAAPRVWEKLKRAAEAQLEADEGLARGFAAGAPDAVAAVRAKLGLGRARYVWSGAAPIAPDVYAFLVKLGLPLTEIYGTSEFGLGAAAPPEKAKPGTVGPLARGLEGRVADDGELLVRGPSVTRGYRNDPATTAATIDADGWLHTGDVVTIDADGYCTIVDRKRDLIITAGGKNVSPSNIENIISQASPLIGPTMVVGDGRPYIVALITLDPNAAAAFVAKNALDVDPRALVADERILRAVQDAVDAGNRRLSRVEQVKRFTVLPTFWEPGGDELTPTMKLKRKPTLEKYAAEIAELYARPS